VSLGIHSWLTPWDLMPEGFEIRDADGEATLPIDLEEDDVPAAPPPGTGAPKPAATNDPNGVTVDAAVPLPTLDAGAPEAGADASLDGAADDAGMDDGGLDPDARVDPTTLASDLTSSDPAVLLVLNMTLIKQQQLGSKLGPLLTAIPQWDDFIGGTGIDPVRDTDWVMIAGPSLRNTSKDIILIHYTASDDMVDKAVDVVAAKYPQGGPYDAGVANVRAALGHADNAPRVFLRPRPSYLAVLPVASAHKQAERLRAKEERPRIGAGEAFRMRILTPQNVMPQLPPQVTKLTLWIVPNADGSADIYAEGECASAQDALDATTKTRDLVLRSNSLIVQVMTLSLLNGAQVTQSGTNMELTLHASAAQLDAVLNLVANAVHNMKSGQ
jgi:hypothetical protein